MWMIPKDESPPQYDTGEDDNDGDGVETEEDETPAMKALRQLGSVPKKSILKKSNSYTIHAGQGRFSLCFTVIPTLREGSKTRQNSSF